MKNKQFAFKSFSIIILALVAIVILIEGSCNYSWIPQKEDELIIREERDRPLVRFKHNLKDTGALDVTIGKALFVGVQEGSTTDFQKSEDGDVPVTITTNDKKVIYKVLIISKTVGGKPLLIGKKYSMELRKNSKNEMELVTTEEN